MTFSARPRAPDQAIAPVQEGILYLPASFRLHHGGQLDAARLAWRLAGDRRLPIVVVLGGISAHRRVFDAAEPHAGWWRGVAGLGRPLDTEQCCVLGIDYLGGFGDSAKPAPGPVSHSVSTYDQANALRELLDHLELPHIQAILGASYGGMVALAFGERFPYRIGRLVVISAADRTHPFSTAWRCVQRRTVRFARETGRASEGLELARALAMTTYRSPGEFGARFDGTPESIEGRFVFPVEKYLFGHSHNYAAHSGVDEYLTLSESIDLHRVNAAQITVPTAVVAVREDQLVPVADMRALAARLPKAHLYEISSIYGHDAFVKEPEKLRPALSCIYGDC